MFASLARLMYRRRRVVVVVWLVILLVAALTIVTQLGQVLNPPQLVAKDSESSRASATLDTSFHMDDAKVSLVVLANATSTVRDASFRSAVTSVADRLRADRALDIAFLDNPLVSHNPQGISKDGHAVALTFSSNLSARDMTNEIDHVRAEVRAPGFTTYVTGTPAAGYDNQVASQQDLQRAESTTVPILILILILVFGTVLAAGLPLLVALFAIPLGLAGVALFGHVINTSIFVVNVVTVIGLGVSIDYSLFIVYRFREELRRADGDTERALLRTMETTGRAVFLSGVTVAIGLATLMLINLDFMRGMGLGGVLTPVTALLVAMTLLPAILGMLGTKVNRLRVIPGRFLTTSGNGRGAWHRIVGAVMARPVISGGLVLAVMLALAFPLTQLNFAFGSQKNYPSSESTDGLNYMRAHFNSAPSPDEILVQHGGTGSLLQSRQLAGMRALEQRIRQDPDVAFVQGPADLAVPGRSGTGSALKQLIGRSLSPDLKIALITVVPKHDEGTVANLDLVERLRGSIIPAARGSLPGDTITVGGRSATSLDFDIALYGTFPFIVAIVLVLSYVFLLFAFESVVLPLKAVLLNLLSVGAAYGVLVLVFQHGVGSSVLGFAREGGLAPWVPVFLFAFLFGLSMDYEVFLLSRIREGWLASGANRESVALGLERTGRLISSAAAIMVFAFGGFILGRQIQFKEFGFGLVVSVLLDATLVRIVLVPALMELMGGGNWYLPGFLRGIVRRVGLAEIETPTPAPVGYPPPVPMAADQTVVLPGREPGAQPGTPLPGREWTAFLQPVGGPADVRYTIEKPLRIGRSPENDVVLGDPLVSRRHAEVTIRNGGQVVVRDLQSGNGTAVNGERIAGERPLQNGDTITVGNTSLVFHRVASLAR